MKTAKEKKAALSWLVFPEEKPKLKELEERYECFKREMPDMVLQLTLLLNSGLVLDAAARELAASGKDSSSVFLRLIYSVWENCKETNSGFAAELYRVALSSRDRDFIRIAALLIDHSKRGSELSEKLERERSHLWQLRISRAKAESRKAETKLCMPMMLLMLSIIIISTAPALMQM